MSSTAGVLLAGSAPFDSPWLTEQNLANAMSRRVGVLYVEPPFSPLTRVRGDRSLDSTRVLGDFVGPAVRPRGRVYLARPIALPPLEHPMARGLSAPLVRKQVARAAAAAPFEVRAAIVARRMPLPAIPLRTCYLVKDWTPAGADLLGRSPKDLVAELQELADRADVVCAISNALRDKLAEVGVPSRVLRHGFHVELAQHYDDAEPPDDLLAVPEPRLVYAGRIDARLDFDMLDELARHFSAGSIVLIGPLSPRLPRTDSVARFTSRPNVHLLGARSRTDLPAYLVNADCLLLPYSDREWSKFGSPLKMWDYLYAGPPLVGSGYETLKEYPPPLVHYVAAGADYSGTVAAALAEDRAGRNARRAFALANTWLHRADEMLELLGLASATNGVVKRPSEAV